MPGRRYYAVSGYRYGFNGKENDNEVKNIDGSQQDYGMRIYDPRIGKFLSVDPLTEKYPWFTPYQFSGNQPINSIDLDGAENDPVFNKPFFGITVALSVKTISRTLTIPGGRRTSITPFKDIPNKQVTVKNNTLHYKFSLFAAFPVNGERDIFGFNIHTNDSRELSANIAYSTRASYGYANNTFSAEIFDAPIQLKLNVPLLDDIETKKQTLTGILGYNISTGRVGFGFSTANYNEGFIKPPLTEAEVIKGVSKDYNPLQNMDYGTLEPMKFKLKKPKIEMPFKIGTGIGKLPLWGLYPHSEQKKTYVDPISQFMKSTIKLPGPDIKGETLIKIAIKLLKDLGTPKKE